MLLTKALFGCRPRSLHPFLPLSFFIPPFLSKRERFSVSLHITYDLFLRCLPLFHYLLSPQPSPSVSLFFSLFPSNCPRSYLVALWTNTDTRVLSTPRRFTEFKLDSTPQLSELHLCFYILFTSSFEGTVCSPTPAAAYLGR